MPYRFAALVVRPGDLRPGNSPAIVTFGGDLVLGDSATLHIELGGTTPGFGPNNHDRLVSAGQLTIGGTLDVSLIDGFVPANGDRFAIPLYGSKVGDIATFSGVNLGGGRMLVPVVAGPATRSKCSRCRSRRWC